MLTLPYVAIPEDFSSFLKTDMRPNTKGWDQFIMRLQANPSLEALIHNLFYQEKETKTKTLQENTIDAILRVNNWGTIRDKVAATFIHKKKEKHFTSNPDGELIKEIKDCERIISDYCLSGPNRSFMLAFYLLMGKMDGNFKKNDPFVILQNKIIPCLKLMRAKIIKIDWAILILWHFHELLGEEILREKLQVGEDYSHFYGALSEQQKTLMMSNLLSYAASINDRETLTSEIVI
jgi:hypothetical protein